MESNELKISGIMRVSEDLTVEQLHVSGIFSQSGNVKAQSIHCSGIARISGNIEASEVKVSGILKVNGDVKSEHISVPGLLKANALEAEVVEISGGVTIKQSLNCDSLTIEFDAKSTIGEIEAGKVLIVNRKNHKDLNVKSITADEIKVSNVVADTLCGETIIIGPNCKIKQVEYTKSLTIDPSSKVKKQIQMN